MLANGGRYRDLWAPSTPPANDPWALVVFEGGDDGISTQPGARIEAGAHLLAPDDRAIRFGTLDGTQLSIEPGSRLTVREIRGTKRFELLSGAVNVRVRKLRVDERFIVDTVDTEVEVRGTMFTVALATAPPPCGPATLSRVFVWEGVVTVRGAGGGGDVHPGEVWPPRCASAAEAPEPRIGREPGAREPRRLARTDLEAQNDLFTAAVRAHRDGNDSAALRLFDRFIRSYPDAGLFESAVVQRMRVLAVSEPRAAAAAATRYLQRFPDGFARAEAQALRRAAERL